MFERFTDRARSALALAQEEAVQLNHHYIGTEHILLGLLAQGAAVEGDDVAVGALDSLGVTLDAVRTQVTEIAGEGVAAPRGAPPFTPRAKKMLELSLREALQLGHHYIGTEHLLLGLVREGEGVAVQVLANLGVDLAVLRQRVITLMAGAATGPRVPGPSFTGEPVRGLRRHRSPGGAMDPVGSSAAEPLCPRCRAPLSEGARHRTLEVPPGPGERTQEPARVLVVYCGTCGASLHMFPPSPPA